MVVPMLELLTVLAWAALRVSVPLMPGRAAGPAAPLATPVGSVPVAPSVPIRLRVGDPVLVSAETYRLPL